jgi:hypothetical protein
VQELSQLRQWMDRVAALEPPMRRLAALGAVLERPGLLIVGAIVGLAAWGAVTFVAVSLAIVRADRVGARRA